MIESGTISIEYGAFAGLQELESVIIPPTVSRIDSYAFYMCPSLTGIFIPSSVLEIPDTAFYLHYSASLTIYVEAAQKPDGWGGLWHGGCPVVWGYNKNQWAAV